MKTNKLLLIILMATLYAGVTSAAPQRSGARAQMAARTLVANLYKQHKTRSPFFQTKSRALLERYFEKKLANLILKDAIRSRGEVGALDGDPLFNAQEMEITSFRIHEPAYREGNTDVLVTFENLGQKKEINFLLVPRGNDWRIANIKYDDGADLLGILQSESAAAGRDVKVYLVALGDNGKRGKKIGCDDSLVPVTRSINTPAAPLRAALEQLLSLPPESPDYPGLQNFWKGRNLSLRSVAIVAGTATIRISGEVFVAGVCDQPRIVEQIEATARQFPSVRRVKVFIGNQTLANAIR